MWYLHALYLFIYLFIVIPDFFKTAEPVPVIQAALFIGKSYKDNTVSAG